MHQLCIGSWKESNTFSQKEFTDCLRKQRQDLMRRLEDTSMLWFGIDLQTTFRVLKGSKVLKCGKWKPLRLTHCESGEQESVSWCFLVANLVKRISRACNEGKGLNYGWTVSSCWLDLAGSGWCQCFAISKLPLTAQAFPATICVEVVEVFLQSGAYPVWWIWEDSASRSCNSVMIWRQHVTFGTDRIRRFWMFLGEIVGLLSEVMVFLPASRSAFC